jgi:hypothetical protein
MVPKGQVKSNPATHHLDLVQKHYSKEEITGIQTLWKANSDVSFRESLNILQYFLL